MDEIIVNNKPVKQMTLDEHKNKKIEELRLSCQNSILDGFEHVVNGNTYWFSFDIEAQLNFQGIRALMEDGTITEIGWTVRLDGKSGDYQRIIVDSTIMSELSLKILYHKDNNISRLREDLIPQVEASSTIEEVKNITW